MVELTLMPGLLSNDSSIYFKGKKEREKNTGAVFFVKHFHAFTEPRFELFYIGSVFG